TRGNVWLGLLTGNVREGARIKLNHFELFHYFRCGGFGDEHFERDDVARDALREVQGLLSRPIDLSCVWVVGDTPLDVQCARASGARAVAVTTGWPSREELAAARPDLLLGNLSDPAQLLSCLE